LPCDELFVFDVALTDAQMLSIYRHGLDGTYLHGPRPHLAMEGYGPGFYTMWRSV
jgi:hypothetical protein